MERILHRLDVSQSHKLETAAKKAQEIISSAEIPTEVAKEIVEYYHAMGKILRDPYVAVRSSATAEDLPNASFAGQQATFLNIKGEASVVHHVRLCWASLFTARAIFYRVENKFDHFKVGIAVPVQKMVQSDVSGIMFTINPVTSEKSTIVIEGIYGLGELIVQGAVTPDHYEVDKNSLEITHKKINSQEKQMLLKRGKTIIDYVPQSKRALSKITDAQVTRLAEFGKLLEKHYRPWHWPREL